MGDDTETMAAWAAGYERDTAEPGLRGLGVLALVFAVISAMLAMTVYLTLWALLGSVVALGLGSLSLGDYRSRGLGIGAIAIASLTLIGATVVLITMW